MDIQFQTKEANLGQISISVTKTDVEEKVKKSLKDIAKTAHLKGFRPGMAPAGMIKKMYGNSVLFDEIDKILNSSLQNYIKENKLETLGQPMPVDGQKIDFDIDSIRDFNFDFEIGLAPEVSLDFLNNSKTFTKYKIAVEENAVNEEVDRIRKRFATYEYPDTVELNDVVTYEIKELNEDGSEKEGGINTTSSIMLDLVKEDWQKKLIGMKKDDTIALNVFELMERDREATAKNILNLTTEEEIATAGNNYKLTVTNITRNVPAEINAEFFEKVYGEGGVDNLEDMKAEIVKDFESYYEGQTNVLLVNDIYREIMDTVQLDLPDAFLKRWIASSNEKKITNEQLESEYPMFSKQLRWDLITSKISREQNISVTMDELKERVRQDVIKQLYGYGLRNLGGDWVDNFVKKQTEDRKVLERTEEQLLDDKVLDYIKSKINTSEKSISLEEFNELIRQENEKAKQA